MLRQFIREEEGQTTVEYLLIIAVMVVIITMFGKQATDGIKTLTAKVFQQLGGKVDTLMNAGQ